MAACLAVFMAVSVVPSDVLAMESEVSEQSDGSKQISEEQSAGEQQEEGIEELDVYDMYRDGSGKNIESGEKVPKQIQGQQDGIPSQGDRIQSIGGMKIGNDGLELIKDFELCKLKAYKPVATEKYYTIGWGHYGPDVEKDMVITQERADQLLVQDINKFEGYVNNFSQKNKVNLNQNQFDALVSFTYNVGTSWMTSSTIRTYLLNGIEKYTDAQITNAFVMWNKAGGKVLAGLTRRRKAEAELFLRKSVTSTLPTISGYSIPTDMNEGSSFSIRGLISSDTILEEVSAGVYDEAGNFVIGKTATPNIKSYSLTNLDNAIAFGKLKAGAYRYIVSATNARGKKELINQEFQVICKHSYVSTTTKANPKANGKIVKKCSKCGTETGTTTIYAPKTMKLSATSYTYTGTAKKPSVTVTDSKGKTISSSNYTVSYATGRVNVGTYKVTVKVNPEKVNLRSVTSTSGGKMLVKWTKNTKATGYQIQYAKSSSFSGSKTVNVSGNSVLYKTISSLTRGKRYYVRVRCYKTVNGVKYYSSYSDKKSVIIKK